MRDLETDNLHSESLYDYDLRERSYMDELLEKDEHQVANDMYGSRLSLISEESDPGVDPESVSVAEKKRLCVQVVMQESMI